MADTQSHETIESVVLKQIEDEAQVGQENDSKEECQHRNHFNLNELRRFISSDGVDIFLKVL
jgi:hypothetical protein